MKIGTHLFFATLFFSLALGACDKAVRFHPVGWVEERSTWTLTTSSFHVRIVTPGGLVGQKTIAPQPEVRNLTDQELTFAEPVLLTLGHEYPGDFGASRTERVILPHETERIAIFFDLGKPLRDALGDTIEIRVQYKVGQQPVDTLQIRLEREN